MNLLDGEIYYFDIVNNWDNHKNWDKWQDCLWIAQNIPNCQVKVSPEQRVIRFTNNWLIESAVATALNVNFFDNTHATFHSGYGERKPDFMDDWGTTYELKTTKYYAYDAAQWWDADVHLFYDKKDGILYRQEPNNHYEYIMDLKIELLKEEK